jgi:hypothetical protein
MNRPAQAEMAMAIARNRDVIRIAGLQTSLTERSEIEAHAAQLSKSVITPNSSRVERAHGSAWRPLIASIIRLITADMTETSILLNTGGRVFAVTGYRHGPLEEPTMGDSFGDFHRALSATADDFMPDRRRCMAAFLTLSVLCGAVATGQAAATLDAAAPYRTRAGFYYAREHLILALRQPIERGALR